jgi:DNA polymerase-3 subunit epsilon
MMPYCFFDTETTGLPDYTRTLSWKDQPRIVQLAAILTDDAGKTMGEMNVLIRPEGWTLPRQASHIHGITDEIATKFGVPIGNAISMFLAIGVCADLIVAHNLEFDRFMINREGLHFHCDLESGWRSKFCTMEATKDVLKIPPSERMIASGRTGYKSPSLKEAYRHFFSTDPSGAHDAMSDARACKEIFFALRRYQQAIEGSPL